MHALELSVALCESCEAVTLHKQGRCLRCEKRESQQQEAQDRVREADGLNFSAEVEECTT